MLSLDYSFFFSSSSLSSLFERCWNKVAVKPVLYLFQLLCACVCLRTTLIHNNVYYLFISEILTLHLVFYFISCFASSIYDYFTLFLYSLLEIVSFQYLLQTHKISRHLFIHKKNITTQKNLNLTFLFLLYFNATQTDTLLLIIILLFKFLHECQNRMCV